MKEEEDIIMPRQPDGSALVGKQEFFDWLFEKMGEKSDDLPGFLQSVASMVPKILDKTGKLACYIVLPELCVASSDYGGASSILPGLMRKTWAFEINIDKEQKGEIRITQMPGHFFDLSLEECALLRDLTKRLELIICCNRTRNQVELLKEQLLQADKMVALGTLVSGVAHEINNPNNFIMLNIPVIQAFCNAAMPYFEKRFQNEGDFPIGKMRFSRIRDRIPALFRGIFDGSNRIKNIVNDLKDYVRQDTCGFNEKIDLQKVMASAVSLLENLLRNSTMNFSVIIEGDIPMVRGNFQRLEQVIINHLQNACEALPSKDKGIKVILSGEEKNQIASIRIVDQGIGMNENTMKHIMNPFFTTKREKGGTGLGLSVSSTIIKAHSGTIFYTSKLGEGTTAWIRLPAYFEEEAT